MSIYRSEVLDRARNPRHRGLLSSRDIRASEANTMCGDEITIDLEIIHKIKNQKSKIKNFKLNDPMTQSTIEAVGFEGSGCIISQAAADMLLSQLIGKTLEEVAALPDQFVFDFFGGQLTPSRQTCALLALAALREHILSLKTHAS